MTRRPTKSQIEKARREIQDEDNARQERMNSPEVQRRIMEINRKSNLPSEDPEHICGMRCDGQDGQSSHCYRLRKKLGLV